MTPRRLKKPRLFIRTSESLLTRLLLATGAAMAILTPTGVALAHVDIDVGDGQYVMEVGFRDEPAFLGQPNALYVSVEEYATGGTEPVEDLAATLEAEVSKDGQTMTMSLVPMGEGQYEAPFVPTATGDYTFRISGAIGEATIDESVTSGPTTFNSVEPLTAIEFPVSRPDPATLQAETADARATAAMARILGIAGIAAGALGLIVAAIALSRAGRPRPVGAAPASASPASQAAPDSPASEPTGKLIR